jgi:rod shape-determining protein MreB
MVLEKGEIIERGTHDVIASGVSAKRMIGKTPSNIRALRPLKDGVITDLEVTSLMLHDFFAKLDMTSMFNRPSALVCIPYGITEVERRAVEDASYEAGARSVSLIEEPIAAAIGTGLKVAGARGNMIVDIGGGTTEVAVISLGGIVASNTLRVAGDAFDAAIVSYMKVRHSVLIGEATAELLKMRIGSAHPRYDRGELQVWGRSLRNGLAACITVQSGEIREAITEQLELIAASVKAALEETPPELSADIFDTGIMLTGGCSLIPGLPQLLEDSTGIRVRLSKHPFDSVCMGIGRCVETSDSSEFIRKRR